MSRGIISFSLLLALVALTAAQQTQQPQVPIDMKVWSWDVSDEIPQIAPQIDRIMSVIPKDQDLVVLFGVLDTSNDIIADKLKSDYPFAYYAPKSTDDASQKKIGCRVNALSLMDTAFSCLNVKRNQTFNLDLLTSACPSALLDGSNDAVNTKECLECIGISMFNKLAYNQIANLNDVQDVFSTCLNGDGSALLSHGYPEILILSKQSPQQITVRHFHPSFWNQKAVVSFFYNGIPMAVSKFPTNNSWAPFDEVDSSEMAKYIVSQQANVIIGGFGSSKDSNPRLFNLLTVNENNTLGSSCITHYKALNTASTYCIRNGDVLAPTCSVPTEDQASFDNVMVANTSSPCFATYLSNSSVAVWDHAYSDALGQISAHAPIQANLTFVFGQPSSNPPPSNPPPSNPPPSNPPPANPPPTTGRGVVCVCQMDPEDEEEL